MTKPFEPMEQNLGKDKDRVLPTHGAMPDYGDIIEPVSDPSTIKDKARMTRFMEESLLVMIHESPVETNPEPHVFLSVNGTGAMPGNNPWVPRGTEVTIKRKYVERLARAKPVTVKTVDGIDANGDKTKNIRRSRALAYPFSVLHDPNPVGHQWLKTVLAES